MGTCEKHSLLKFTFTETSFVVATPKIMVYFRLTFKKSVVNSGGEYTHHVDWVPCHHGMAWHLAVDGTEGLQTDTDGSYG